MRVKVLIRLLQGFIASADQASGLLAALPEMSHHPLTFTVGPFLPLRSLSSLHGPYLTFSSASDDNSKDISSMSGSILFCPS